MTGPAEADKCSVMSVTDSKLKSLIRIGEKQNYLKIERIKP